MYRRSPITIRLFLMLLALIGSIFAAIYIFTVPLIKENVFRLELNGNRQVLNIVYDLANRMYTSTESYVDRTLKSHEQRLSSVLDMTENHIEVALREGRKEGLSEEQIWNKIFTDLRSFQFGNGDYVWISNYDARLLSHPSEKYHGQDMSQVSDPDGNLIIPGILQLALSDGQGFYKYKWNRLNETRIIDKFSYVKDYSKWGFVMGAGVYIDDIEQEVEAQKQKAIEEINRALKKIKIATNGYLYIFDSNGNMLFHPNPNIHGLNFKDMLNPVTKHPIYLDLMEVADTGNELYYKWDRPDDPGHYEYEKLSLVRHLSGFDWYISSSVYLDDLKASSVQLSQRIMAMGFFALMIAIVAVFFFAEWITSPIKSLSSTAYKISRGNLNVKTGIDRDDELGMLAESFDIMVERLGDNINTLNLRVEERTKELSDSNAQLLEAVDSLQNTQDELRAVETRQRLILDALPAQVAYLDPQLRYIFANRQYREMFDQTKEGIVGKHFSEVVGPEMSAALEPYIDQAKQGDTPVYEYKINHHGEEILTRRTVLPFYNMRKEVEGMLTLSIDITAEREVEERMAEASKMKAVGQMSGGLAHDFNNLLTIILGNLLELQNNQALPEHLQKNLSPAIRATRRGADMTKRLLAFSRRQPLVPGQIKPDQLIGELIDLLAAPLPENIQLKTRINPNTPAVYVDAAQMEDALVNLALNSVDAMPKGGELRLVVSGISHIDHQVLSSHWDDEVKPGFYVLISVIDSGEGFSEDALYKACEPFFTTKATGAGSGLGMSMVYGFVKQSQGYLRFQNNESDVGARVDILLPAVDEQEVEAVPEVEQGAEPTEFMPESSLVLLVEDNHDVRKLVRSQLTEMGFMVIEATSGDEALAMMTGLDNLAGVVSDVIMPGASSGYEVINAVKLLYPKAFAVIMTGYSDTPPETDFEYQLLQKPFTADHLKSAISKLSQLQKVKEESS
ncbi:cache domain-containing protein [Neptuniibacter caesariensis]|uniref:histidine kinase n=1 Tax=Neptuniibacter caesariensis TaxID=207954 RepID=A0A7U8C872_NEPCE|nr:cache domain-containing protein [Neptuniibacter caesariensis]EAR61596.1 PAS protein [Oceanospirillum sp. MED92] [Neptuniibacter caesariensis]